MTPAGQVVVIALAAVLAGCSSEPKPAAAPAAPTKAARSGPDVAALTGYGRYDEAARLGEELLREDPNDAKALADMAALQLALASRAPEQRAQHVASAEQYADRLAAAHAADPGKLFVAAGIFKRAAGMSRDDVCPHYARAYQLLKQRGEVLEGGAGREEAVKRQNQKDIEELQATLERGRCTY